MTQTSLRRRGLAVLSMLLAGVAAVAAALPTVAYAKVDSPRTVRVAFPRQEGITFRDDNGNYSGYTYDYLQILARYTGWSFEFVELSGETNHVLVEMMEQVREGKIDLMGSTFYDQELNKTYDYSAYSYGIADTELKIPINSDLTLTGSAVHPQKMTIAVYEGATRSIEELMKYCQRCHIEPEFVYCKTESDLHYALESGRADAALTISFDHIAGTKGIARFSPKPFYFITGQNGDPELISELNAAMAAMEENTPNLQNQLYRKYFVESGGIQFTRQEEAFLAESGEITVAMLVDRPPYQYRSAAGTPVAGIAVDVLDYITAQTGLKFNILEADSWDSICELIESGRVQMVSGLSDSATVALKHNMGVTQPFITPQCVMLANKAISAEHLDNMRIAMPVMVKNSYFDNADKYQDIAACVDAVNSDGIADCTFLDIYTAQYYINQYKYSSLRMIPQTILETEYISFGVLNPGGSKLLSVLNKVINYLPQEYLQSYVTEHTLSQSDITLIQYLQQNSSYLFGLVILLLLLLVLWLIIAQRRHTAASRRAALDLKKHLQIYSLTGDSFFEYDMKMGNLLINLPERYQEDSGASQVKYTPTDLTEPAGSAFVDVIKRGDGTYEELMLCSDGEERWLQVIVKMVCDDEGLPVYAVGKVSNIDEERKRLDQLMDKASRDSLTHLLNSDTSRRMTEKELAELDSSHMGALIIMDVDNFKDINDSYGHMFGDRVLCKVAQLLQECFRSYDIIGRLGGDEFVVYMKSIQDINQLDAKCDDIYQRLNSMPLTENDDVRITVSIGAVLATRGSTYSELYRKADKALYSVKNRSRNGFEIAED